MQDLHQILETKPTIAAAAPSRHTPLRQAAVRLSNRNRAAAKAELLNTALQRLTALCYDMDAREGGAPPLAWNVDGRDGRILVPVPMGSVGRTMYGLRRIERDTLRAILLSHDSAEGDAPLYLYDGVSNLWMLNIFDYRTVEAAREWLKRNRVTARQWLDFSSG